MPGRHFVNNLVERRSLLFELVRRDFHQRFVGSAAGWLWGVIHPLVMLFSWWFVFRVCMRFQLPPDAPTQIYVLFLFVGNLPWLLFQETIVRSSASLLDHSNLITKTVFPSEIVPVSIFLSSLIHHLIAVGLATLAIGIFDGGVSPMMWFLPIYVILTGLMAIGFGWMAASLNVYLRDTGQVVQVVLMLWFWITPIFLTPEQVPERLRFLVRWNPMSYIVDGYRSLMLDPYMPWPDWRQILVLTVVASIIFIVGGLFFRHLKRGFADVL
ncbi:MAG TPA: ABC transporter permease [Bryobacteraceae bacterium]